MEELISLREKLMIIRRELRKEIEETGQITAAARFNQLEAVINMIDDRIYSLDTTHR